MVSKFESVDDVVNYLREPNASSTDSRISNNRSKSSQKKRKGKNQTSATPLPPQSQLEETIQILPKGRVRYGPITINPRKQPSKTLYTGRRSKYEVLSADEEEKRRDRRDRNRVAATKCREKRENVLDDLENKYNGEVENNKRLMNLVNNLQQRKNHLDSVLTTHLNECPLLNIPPPPMIFGDSSFLSSIIDAPAPPLPTYQQVILYNDEEEFSHLLDPTPVLTNSAYSSENSNSVYIPPLASMTNSSIEHLLNNLQSPTISMENCNNHSMLFNSAVGSSCAKQHSTSSEDDSLPPKHTNSYVC